MGFFMEWEYYVMERTYEDVVGSAMCELGNDGWEFVSAIETKGYYKYIFKRPLDTAPVSPPKERETDLDKWIKARGLEKCEHCGNEKPKGFQCGCTIKVVKDTPKEQEVSKTHFEPDRSIFNAYKPEIPSYNPIVKCSRCSREYEVNSMRPVWKESTDKQTVWSCNDCFNSEAPIERIEELQELLPEYEEDDFPPKPYSEAIYVTREEYNKLVRAVNQLREDMDKVGKK